jgi:hypothetical protein
MATIRPETDSTSMNPTRSRQERVCRLIFAVLALSAAALVVLLVLRAHQSLNSGLPQDDLELSDP